MRRDLEKVRCKNMERTLFAGVISIVLCCAALFGTAYAWMMDSVSHDVATIQAGTLEMDLVDASENGRSFIIKAGAARAESTIPLVFTKMAAADVTQIAEGGEDTGGEENSESTVDEESIIAWDLGETYQLPAMYVVNKGTTALEYSISVERTTNTEAGEGTAVNLTDLIDFKIQINGIEFDGTSVVGDLLPDDNPDMVVISGSLRDDVDLNGYQGKELSEITIKVEAKQTGQ